MVVLESLTEKPQIKKREESKKCGQKIAGDGMNRDVIVRWTSQSRTEASSWT